MKAVFWLSLLAVNYTYWGYPALLGVLSLLRTKPVLRGRLQPTVSVLMSVRNEGDILRSKLENLRALEYPEELLQVIVVSDGSTDQTTDILQQNASWIHPIILLDSVGKASAINEAVKMASGEIFVFFDVRQVVSQDALRELTTSFADPSIGAVSGELHLTSVGKGSGTEGLGFYWKLEKLIRRLESSTGSVMGVTGAIYALRRELFVPLPKGTLLDDVLVPMQVVRAGKRVIFQPSAKATDILFEETGKEFARKVRTLSGNYQLLQLAPWLLSPQNPCLGRFVSHKILRLFVPFFLIALLISSALADGVIYNVALASQLLLYGLAVLGVSRSLRSNRFIGIAYTFTSLNIAALISFRNFIFQRHDVWQVN
jgi:biofilm PGA synthesis N-glycosyltransferase PgaC